MGTRFRRPRVDQTCESRLSASVTFAEENQDGTSAIETWEGGNRMNTTLRQTLKSLLYAGAALMLLVAGSANWPKH
jgi:hypothetical protein